MKKEEGPQKGKIITVLWQRRTIETLMRRLIDARSDAEVNAILTEILSHGEQVIPAILANLGTTDPHFRGALGLVAKHLPHEQIAPALWGALRDASLSDHARLTAGLILERFLGETVPPEALGNVSNPTQVALQSLQEVISESRRSRAILIEYIEAFEEQAPEIQQLVLDALESLLQGDDVVELLRMLAQSPSPAVSQRAVDMLTQLRTPAAARALQILRPTVSRALLPAVERALRKLQFAGVPVSPLPPAGGEWRALVSPVDGRGDQSIWFIQETPEGKPQRFFGLHLNDQAGIVEAVGSDQVEDRPFPPASPLGQLHLIALRPEGPHLYLLEAPYDYGRLLVRQALKLHDENAHPMPAAYRLYNDALWAYDVPELERAAPSLPEPSPEERQHALARSGQLLETPAFSTWFVRSELILTYAQHLRRLVSAGGIVAVPRTWLAELADRFFSDPERCALYAARLRRMAEWLWLSGQRDLSQLALSAGIALENIPPAEHPFLLSLMHRSLGLALGVLSRGMDAADASEAPWEEGLSPDAETE